MNLNPNRTDFHFRYLFINPKFPISIINHVFLCSLRCKEKFKKVKYIDKTTPQTHTRIYITHAHTCTHTRTRTRFHQAWSSVKRLCWPYTPHKSYVQNLHSPNWACCLLRTCVVRMCREVTHLHGWVMLETPKVLTLLQCIKWMLGSRLRFDRTQHSTPEAKTLANTCAFSHAYTHTKWDARTRAHAHT